MEKGEVVVSASGVALCYGRRAIIDGVSFSIRAGDFWSFIGPNGSGKTTLVRGILGLLGLRAGTFVRHEELEGGRRVGFVPQRGEIAGALPMTVRELVLLGTVRSGLGRRDARAALDRALARVGHAERRREDYSSLSGGQRQRALVARALVRMPRLLILDEPTAGLDVATTDGLLRFLEDLHAREGLTIVLVTHDLEVAARYATHLGVFEGGRVIAGPRAEVLEPTRLESIFGVRIDVAVDASGAYHVRVRPQRTGGAPDRGEGGPAA